MNKLAPELRAEILVALCKGASMRGIARSTGVSVNTAAKLLIDAGNWCRAAHDSHTRGVEATRFLCVKSGSRLVTGERRSRSRSGASFALWTWVAFESESGLIVSHHVGDCSAVSAAAFLADFRNRMAIAPASASEAQLSWVSAEAAPFRIDTGDDETGAQQSALRISTADPASLKLVSGIMARRYTRLRNAYSRKVENFSHMVAISTIWHNYVRRRGTEPTRGMRAGLTDHPWRFEELLELIDGGKTGSLGDV